MQLWIVNTVVFHLIKINLLIILELLIFFDLLLGKFQGTESSSGQLS